MSIIKHSFDSSALAAFKKQTELMNKLQIENSLSELAVFQQNKFAEIMQPLTSQMEQHQRIWNSSFRDQYKEIIRPLQETLSSYDTLSKRLYNDASIAQSLNVLRSELYDSFKIPELVQLVSSKWDNFVFDFDRPQIDLFIDETTNAFTDYTAAIAANMSSFSIEDFDYSIDEDGLVHLSDPLEAVVTNVFDVDEPKASASKEKLFTREFFYSCVFPFLLLLIQLAVSFSQDAQQTKLSIEQHQQQMAVYREILSEEKQQTDIAEKTLEEEQRQTDIAERILEQEQQQTEYLKMIAEKDD